MQTIIMTVGTSLRTNRDEGLEAEYKRPWSGKNVPNTQRAIDDLQQAMDWMGRSKLELISAETNSFWRLDSSPEDEILLLHSDTVSGLECAEVLKVFLEVKLGQKDISLHELPGINYALDESGSTLERMAALLKELIDQAKGSSVTLAATGGFKAQTMVMALVGNSAGVRVCYIHEDYKSLIYLPYLSNSGQAKNIVRFANLPQSGVPRSSVIKVRSDKQEPNRPRIWAKVEQMLKTIPWVDSVYYDERAYTAPQNGVKAARQKTEDGRHILWMHLCEKEKKMALAVETTGYTPEHLEQAATEMRERLGTLV